MLYILYSAFNMQVNILGTSTCAQEFVKQLRERGVDDGHLVVINGYVLVQISMEIAIAIPVFKAMQCTLYICN